MGYEAIFYYFERGEDGKYDLENKQEFRQTIGEKTDSTPLDELASTIISQLARRDVWITEVDAYEFKKAKITFKEAKGGIILKNKKFLLNKDVVEVSSVEQAPQPVPIQPQAPQPAQPLMQNSPMQFAGDGSDPMQFAETAQSQPQSAAGPMQFNAPAAKAAQPVPVQHRAPLRFETYDPEPDLLQHVKDSGNVIPLTIKNKYPILDEKVTSRGVVYTLTDDKGQYFQLHSIYFIPERRDLVGGADFNEEAKRGPSLSFEGQHDQGMPVLRRM